MATDRMTTRLAGAVALVATATAGAPLLAQAGVTTSWSEIAKCGEILKDKDRLACVDAVLDKAGVLASAQKRKEQKLADGKKDFGLSVPQRETAARKEAERIAKETGTPTVIAPPAITGDGAPGVDAVETSIKAAFDPGNKRYVFVTADGQVWQQSELKDIGLPPAAGTAFKVEKTALGGYMCQVGKYRVFRCKRQA